MIINYKHLRTVLLTLFFAITISFNLAAQTAVKDTSAVKKDKDYYLLEGIREYNNQNYTEAKEAFSKVLELEPANDAAYYYLSNISINGNDIVSGEMLLKKAIELDTTNYWYKNLLAKIYLSTKKTKEAVEVYETLLKQFPQRTDSYYALVNLYINAEDLDKSNEILDKIEQLQGKNESTIMTRFNLYRLSRDWEGALKYLVESNKEVSSPRIETLIGDMYADRYRDSLAMSYYKKAQQTEEGYAPAIYGEAELYRRSGDYKHFFTRINPFMSSPIVNPQMKSEYLKQLFQTPGFAQKFKPQLDTLIDNFAQAHPTDTTTAFIASSYFAQTGNRAKSRAIIHKILRAYPAQRNVVFQYLTFLYYGQEWTALEKDATTALLTFPDNMDFIQLKGIAQYQSNKLQDAIETYSELEKVALQKKDTTNILLAYSMMGDLNHEIGNTKLSYSNYKKALKVNPNYNAVLNNYAYFLALEGKNLKEAYNMSLKTIESEPDNPTYLDTFAWILYLMDKPVEAKTHLKHAMLYGGKESAAILDHYAEVLYTLKEYDLAFIYWDQAHALDNTMGIKEKIQQRKAAMKK